MGGVGGAVETGVEGNIVLGLPLPPGTLTTLWGDDDRYKSSYLQAFEGYYATGDSGYRDEDGVLKAGADVPEAVLARELIALVRRDIGAVADFKSVAVVEALPKTRSGKILRKTMRQIADGDDYVVPSTIEDAEVLERLIGTLRPADANGADGGAG